jgi:hypothetical protein
MMCLLHITLLQFQIFIRKHLTLHYMVFCLKNHTKRCVGQYFLDIQTNRDPMASYYLSSIMPIKPMSLLLIIYNNFPFPLNLQY